MCKRKKSVGKIYKTTDGYLTNHPIKKKPRRVAAIDQRVDDGALAVVKIYSKKEKDGKYRVKKLVLKPEKHKSLTVDSEVGTQVIIGYKDGDTYRALYASDMVDTGDKLKRQELKKVKRQAGGTDKKLRQTNKRKMRRWKKHFRQ